jgi:hypothetical protein
MENTNVKLEFIIVGDDFDPEIITDKLLLTPSHYWKNGDKIKNKDKLRTYSCWSIGTDYEESLDINNQLEKIISTLKTKKTELGELKKRYELDYRFEFVINVENNEKPAMSLNLDVIEFAYEIKAEFDFDLYVFS